MADAGARVIKVERPEGDFARSYDHVAGGESAYFVWLNRGKESICLDLTREEDKAVLAALPRSRGALRTVETIDASEVIEMHESPVQAVRRKKDASMAVCGDLVRSGRADAMVSAGNTGAAMAVALTKWGRIQGIDRPGRRLLGDTCVSRSLSVRMR